MACSTTMEAITLPLGIVGALLLLLALAMLLPRAVSLPLSIVLSKGTKNPGVKSCVYTVCILLFGVFCAAFSEVVRGDRTRRGDVRGDLVATVDYLRAQVSCALCLLNLMLCLLIPALAEERRAHDSKGKNLDAMQRQTKGLQAEYERMTKSGALGGGDDGEAAALKAKVDRLIREKAEQQGASDASARAQAGAEAKVDALLSQIKGFDKEYDRVLEENKMLQRRLAQLDATGGYRPTDKKGD
ncbi:hypothetical protein FOA52_000723 [Chlamydomonas sp. UWO 241]|nr:hypothetical protein FOA52_000723 [Chlamydomonas sp. UWO 241]